MILGDVDYYHEFDSERLSIALKETEDDGIEPSFLRIAFYVFYLRF